MKDQTLWQDCGHPSASNKAQLCRSEENMVGQAHLILRLIGCNTLEMIGQVFERFSIGCRKVEEVELQFDQFFFSIHAFGRMNDFVINFCRQN